ncbi:hypothetical protein DU506_00925 [Vreelandella rituensis]|uniref:Uncharacterized protein n=3 Tax=Vreelandella rituensis TaxID=2282306 RepID=A0A368U958_9GAMM|nr:hypothetical protein DU506_00925 [Halomonas rituensis]
MHDDPIVISHNALTSRRFFDTRFPAHARLRWGCSARDLDWHKRYGYQGKILETLCMQTGAFYESGRSINEAAALAWLLNRHSCMVSQLLARADQDETLVDAFGLPLEQKATVRQAGFEWVADGRGKRLHKRVPFDQAESLQQWLTGLGAVPGLVTLDCRSRFAAM